MRLITLEEHYRAPMVKAALEAAETKRPGDPPADSSRAKRVLKLDELGTERLADMDAGGIAVQVLSHGAPATEPFEAEQAVALAAAANDHVAEAVAAHPERFAAFATLPMADPTAAAQELERTITTLGFKGAMINGLTHGRFLDDRSFAPIFETAQRVGVPIYLHPAEPPDAVRSAYYSGLPPQVAQMLATAGWGWHAEAALHALRLVIGGVFDEFPELQVILGHMGESLPFMLARSSKILTHAADLPRSLEDYFAENFHFTTSGMFSSPPLQCLLQVVGSDRVMFSVDYPYSDNGVGRDFILGAPISASDRDKIAHGNAERLLGLEP